MELIMLGTGSASSIQFYNACFALKKNQEYMLIDGGGGNPYFRAVKKGRDSF